MSGKEAVGVTVGAVVIGAGLQKVYEVKKWDVPTPVWLGVTGALTFGGWLAYQKWCPLATSVVKA